MGRMESVIRGAERLFRWMEGVVRRMERGVGWMAGVVRRTEGVVRWMESVVGWMERAVPWTEGVIRWMEGVVRMEDAGTMAVHADLDRRRHRRARPGDRASPRAPLLRRDDAIA